MPGAWILQSTFISEGIKPIITDNYMIQDSHIEQFVIMTFRNYILEILKFEK
jgi:hypothetical protein